MKWVTKTTILFLLISVYSTAQYITVNDNYTAEDLVKNVLINSTCANVSNISVSGWISPSSNPSYGYFSKGTSNFPFNNGVIISTGRAVSAVGPNNYTLSEGPTSWYGDQDLEYAIGENNTINATVLEFDFMPLANKVSFEYIFASEQYLSSPGSHQCNYSDGFGFLLKEVGTSNYQNLAVVPGTNVPVKVTTVRGQTPNCPTANAQYFGGFNDSEHPTNFNGQTVILKAEATVTPNVLYHIKLVIADQGNNLYDSAIFLGGGSFKVTKDLGTDRLMATNNPLCTNETLPLDATMPGTNTYQWFKNNNPITGATQPTFLVTEPGAYTVEITLDNTTCKATGEIEVEYSSNPVVSNTVLTQCDIDSDGLAVFNLNEANQSITNNNPAVQNLKYYLTRQDAQDATAEITNNTAFPNTAINQVVYARVQNAFGCYSISELTLQTANNPMSPIAFEKCDEDATQDGITSIELDNEITPLINAGIPAGSILTYYATIAEAQIDSNPLPNAFSNSQPLTQTIYAKIKQPNGSCFGIVAIQLTIYPFSPSNFQTETLTLCVGSTMILGVPNGFTQYEWSTGESTSSILINNSNTYTVTVTNANGCKATKTFVVNPSDKATIESIQINDFSSPNNTVTINVSGPGKYEFSLDGIFFQDSNLFTNVAAGDYTIVVKDKNECGIVTQPIYVLDYPKFFTPNGDGYNDTWYIKNLPSSSTLFIFDRYGKLLKQISSTGEAWDGTYNGHALPTSDYWFVLKHNSIIIKNHFTLKR
jgi:gliding motility-associated-like protein